MAQRPLLFLPLLPGSLWIVGLTTALALAVGSEGCAPDAKLVEPPAGGGTTTASGGNGAGGTTSSGGTTSGGGGGGDGGTGGYAPGPGEFGWAQLWGDASYQHITAVASTPDGGIIVGGSFTGTLTCGTETHPASGVRFDAFVARLETNGECAWLKHWGSSQTWAQVWDIATDDDSIVAVGNVAAPLGGNSITIEGRTVVWTDQVTDATGGEQLPIGEMFVVRLDHEGTVDWVLDPPDGQTPGSLSPRHVQSVALADGQIVVAGRFYGTTKIHPLATESLTHPEALPPAEATPVEHPLGFVASFAADMTHRWTVPLPSVSNGPPPKYRGATATIAPSGQVIAAFSYEGNAVVSTGVASQTTLTADEVDSVLVNLSLGTGVEIGGPYLRYAGPGEQWVRRLAIGGGMLFVAGDFDQELTACSRKWAEAGAPNNVDGFIARYALPMAVPCPFDEQRRLLRGENDEKVRSLVADAEGVFARVEFTNFIDFADQRFDTRGLDDTLVIGLSPALAPLWGAQIGSESGDTQGALALNPGGFVVAAGRSQGSLWLGPDRELSGLGDWDAFIVTIGR